MSSLLLSRRDLDFLLHEWLDVTRLTARKRFAEHSRETFDAVLELGERIATDHFAPHNKLADAHEPHLDADGRVVMIPEVKRALRVFAEAGLLAGELDESLGGMQLPTVVSKAVLAWFQAANVGTAAYPFLTIANANLLVEYGTPEQVDTWVRPMAAGRFLGTMCLSEPQAGSSLADIATRAEPQPDGTYRLYGTKMWISAGEHELSENIVHLVLAKIPGGPPGVKGISLFIVPKVLVNADGSLGERNDIALVGLNHKMGYRGTVNTVLNFGEGAHTPGGAPGAVGYLVGEPHKGLSYMFHMMNEARIGVGLGAAALGYTGYLHSLEYAKVRLQGRPPAAKDPALPPVPLIEHADVRRMLLAQKAYVEGALALGLYCSLLVDDSKTAEDAVARDRAALLLDVLTPIAKSWPSQWCLEANSLAIQVHGGYGYTREYNVEQFYRDNRLNPIHEGTHGIQGLDLLGRKVVMKNGMGLRVLGETISATVQCAIDLGGETAEMGRALQDAFERLTLVTAQLWSAGDPAVTLANSSIYLEAAGHIVVAWIWLEQVLAAHGKDGPFYAGKRQAARYFFRYELPKTGPQLDLLGSLDRTTLEMDPSWF
ncbi:acyl-CoA dehydrogenase [Thermomonospora curvata]|uniref:Acyl-CoA dehydrogenase domain protein n=1 Tax=Thermomonospora curvata (strain ATCC 19995 / DSM 43183 / JCM 3096 / KCTC 9072 / NBRC 15933 / NCIMB 10081 / Henssen B9) TaxID=471852 RepID=D1A9B4_THECD|nr:acyl-CoA dehydrogenase [Thermomonospora curvata]ACY96810.1 acyl-CoA dehydrogenase domain protein [Thermomonospora curvata DSM 43183]